MINLNHFTNRLLTNVEFLASNKEDAFIVSKHLQIGRSKLLSRKPNTLLIGCAGSGKSRTHFSPNIELGNTSMIVLDHAGEYLYQHKTNLEQQGFHIYEVDFAMENQHFDLEWFAEDYFDKSKVALFIKVPISHTHYNEKIVNLLYEIYEKLYSTIDADRSLKDNNHLHFYLDEFGALPFDKRFLDYFYVHEEYNISSTISIQTLEVLYAKYGEKESLKLISDMGIIVILDNYSFKYDSIFQMIIKDKFQTDFMSEFLKEIPNDKTTLYEIMKENDCSDCVVYMPGYNLFLDKKYNY